MTDRHPRLAPNSARAIAVAAPAIHPLARILYHVPVYGWALREAIHGSETAKVLFILNAVLVWILSIAWFGYPAIILPALAAVPVMFVLLVAITWDDFGRQPDGD